MRGGGRTDVILDAKVEACEPLKEAGPANRGIDIHEKVKLVMRVHRSDLIHHGQEFPFLERGQLVYGRREAVVRLHAFVREEFVVLRFCCVRYGLQRVVYGDAGDGARVIAEESGMWDAGEERLQVRR